MYKIIIIDDEGKIAEGMAELFPWKSIGFEVVSWFTGARQALEYIENNPVDVVLTDIEMPDISGVELSRKLMGKENIHTIFFSSYDHYEYFRSAIQNGVADYLLKPVNYTALTQCFVRVREKLDAGHCRRTVPEPRAYYDQIIGEVHQYLNEHFRTASLEEAAAKVNLSATYLSRILKEKGDGNFSKILLQIRMEKACEKLKDINFKTYDVAYYIGYDNPKSFSRAFKAHYGISPSEYRKRNLTEE